MIERAEKGETTILLTRAPEKVSIADIEALLSLETANEWEWPSEPAWQWLQNWIKAREKVSVEASEVKNLAELVRRLNQNGGKKGRKKA